MQHKHFEPLFTDENINRLNEAKRMTGKTKLVFSRYQADSHFPWVQKVVERRAVGVV